MSAGEFLEVPRIEKNRARFRARFRAVLQRLKASERISRSFYTMPQAFLRLYSYSSSRYSGVQTLMPL